jgi:hypothetical protein
MPLQCTARNPCRLPPSLTANILAPSRSAHWEISMATEPARPPQNTVALGTGLGVFLVWWTMAITCFWSAYRGYDHGRYDWGLMWGLIGLLLAAAGTAAMLGTWWHLSRVRDS